jgi:hypothetical protein
VWEQEPSKYIVADTGGPGNCALIDVLASEAKARIHDVQGINKDLE